MFRTKNKGPEDEPLYRKYNVEGEGGIGQGEGSVSSSEQPEPLKTTAN